MDHRSINITFSFPGRLKSYNLLLIVGPNNFVKFKISKRNVNSEKVISFIDSFYDEIKNIDEFKEDYNNKKLWLLMDSAATHTSKKTSKFLKKSKVNTIYIPSLLPPRAQYGGIYLREIKMAP